MYLIMEVMINHLVVDKFKLDFKIDSNNYKLKIIMVEVVVEVVVVNNNKLIKLN